VATVESSRAGDLGGQFGFALPGQELPKLGCERWERVGEEQPFFRLLVHGNPTRFLEQLWSN
jgi:hypothetical protein